MQKFIMLMTVSCVAVLSACGGGGSGSDSPPVIPPPAYETLTSTKATTSTLGGVALLENESIEYEGIVQASGKLTHDTGVLVLKSGNDRMKDPDGPRVFSSGTRIYRDPSKDGAEVVTSLEGTSGNYQYVTRYEQSAPSGSSSRDYYGVMGIVTAKSDMPKTAKATYKGDAYGEYEILRNGFYRSSFLENGESTVKADFGSGKVNVEMSDFENGANKPVNRITANNMVISGNRFSGGKITAYKDENQVDLTGPKTSKQAAGAFFGYDAAKSVPDEVGGAVLISGDSGYITGQFIAD